MFDPRNKGYISTDEVINILYNVDETLTEVEKADIVDEIGLFEVTKGKMEYKGKN